MKAPLSAILLMFALPTLASEPGDVADINRRAAATISLEHQASEPFYQGSYADRYFEQAYSLNDINASYYHRSEHRPADVREGDGASMGIFDASAYLRLGSKSVAVAGAGYQTGTVKGVRWNSVADCSALYPYIVGDSLGGDLRREQYHFYGGFASRAGDYVYGMGAKYRATHQYRDYDPRPRNMATELTVSASGSRIIGAHALGLGAEVLCYKQVMDVDYYSQSGANSTQYHFTGLGHTFGRVDGTTYTETRYKGFGYGLSASWLPTGREGLMASASASRLRTRQQIHQLNEAPITHLVTYAARLRLGCKYSRGAVSHMPFIEAVGERRVGKESVIDNGNLGEFAVIGRHHKYSLNALSARAAWLISMSNDRYALAAEPAAGIEWLSEAYLEPYSRESRLSLMPSIRLQAMRHAGLWLLAANADARGGHRPHISPSLTAQRRLDQGAIYLTVAYDQLLHAPGPNRALTATAGYRF